MAVYTHLSNEAIAEIIAAYGLGELQLALGIAEGVENSNYLIETANDKGEENKYILTLYEKRVNPRDLPFFIQLMQHLDARGIDCPQPITNPEGETIGEVAGKPMAIISFLKGRSRTVIRNPHVASLGEVIAKMHIAVADFIPQRENNLSLAGWEKLYRINAARLDELQEGLSNSILQELDYLHAHWPHKLPSGVIHADLFPDNVFFLGNEVSGVIDFYFACYDAFAYELAICMNCWCFEPSGEFNRTKAGLLFKSYQKICPLTEAEIAALPILARGAALRFLLTRAHDMLHHDAGALVVPKDPLEYARKLRFHQAVRSPAEYGL